MQILRSPVTGLDLHFFPEGKENYCVVSVEPETSNTPPGCCI